MDVYENLFGPNLRSCTNPTDCEGRVWEPLILAANLTAPRPAMGVPLVNVTAPILQESRLAPLVVPPCFNRFWLMSRLSKFLCWNKGL